MAKTWWYRLTRWYYGPMCSRCGDHIEFGGVCWECIGVLRIRIDELLEQIEDAEREPKRLIPVEAP